MVYVEAVVRVPVDINGDGFLVKVGNRQIEFKVVEPYISLDGQYAKNVIANTNEVPDDVLRDVLEKVFDGDIEVVKILGVKG